MASKIKEFFRKCWKIVKRTFIFLFILQLFYILLTKWVDPPITITQMVSAAMGDGLRRNYVNMKSISPYAKLAVIASEDQLFPDHDGFDFKSIEKAMKHNQTSKSLHGASTISQQVAKNVFLWQGRGWFRKCLEVYFTFMIELVWGKKRILEVYLNVSEMGKGVFGIEAASSYYFNKHARSLNRLESALIVSAMPNPKLYTIRPLSRRVAARYPWVISQMYHLQDDEDIQKLLQ
jgi:monofunctional biosynthetic peptidoglycan transglycosylase